MGIKLGPDWKKVTDLCLTWPSTGKPCKVVFKHIFFDEYFQIYYNEEGKMIFNNAKKFFCKYEIDEMFATA